MNTILLVADWVTLLYFCLSTMFAAIALFFTIAGKPRFMRFAAINWGISNVFNAGWDFISDQILQHDTAIFWFSLGQLIFAVIALVLSIVFAVYFDTVLKAMEQPTDFVEIDIEEIDDFCKQETKENTMK